MPDYQKGKIYKLWCPDNDLIYIGSTTQPLYSRYREHKSRGNSCISKLLFEASDNVKIELIEEYACNNKMELTKKEGEIMRINDCVNKFIAGRTQKEYYEDNKEQLSKKALEYRNNNKDKINQRMKKYYEENKDKINEYYKEWYENNKDKIKECREDNKDIINQRKKEYRENNKDRINEKKRENYEKNKDIINEKIREKRRLKKLQNIEKN